MILILTSLSSSGVYLAFAETYPTPPTQAASLEEFMAELNKIKTVLEQEGGSPEPYSTKIVEADKSLANVIDESSIRSGGGLRVKYRVDISIDGLEGYEVLVFNGSLNIGDGVNGWTITMPREEAEEKGSYIPEAFKDRDYVPYVLRINDQVTKQGISLERTTRDTNMYQAITIMPKGEATTAYLKEINVEYKLLKIQGSEPTVFKIPVTPSGLQFLDQYIKEKTKSYPGEFRGDISGIKENNYFLIPYVVVKSYSNQENGWYGEANISGILFSRTLDPRREEISTSEFIDELRKNLRKKIVEILSNKLSSIDDDDLRQEIIDDVVQQVNSLDLSKIIGGKWAIESNLGYDIIKFEVNIDVKVDIKKATCSCKTIEIPQGNETIEKTVCKWKIDYQPDKDGDEGKVVQELDRIGGYSTIDYTGIVEYYWHEYLAGIVGELAGSEGHVTDYFYSAIKNNDNVREDPVSDNSDNVNDINTPEEKTYTYKPYFIDSQWIKDLLSGQSSQVEERGENSRVLVTYTFTKGTEEGVDIPKEHLNDNKQVPADGSITIKSNLTKDSSAEEMEDEGVIGWFTVGVNLYSLPGYFENDIFEFFVEKSSASLTPSSLADVQSKGYYKVFKDGDEWTREVRRIIEASESSEEGMPSEGSTCSPGEKPRYDVYVKVDLKFNPPIPQYFIYRSEYRLMAKQVREPYIAINVKAEKLEGKATVTGDVILVPSMAPLLGNGLLDKVKTLAHKLGVNNEILEKFFATSESPSNNLAEKFLSNILPSYIPIPTPDKVALNRYAEGEYLGFYMVTGRIENIFVPPVGIPIATFFYESWSITYTGAGGVLRIDKGSTIKLEDGNQITVTSLGIGIGEILGKSIGRRLYIVPSKPLESQNNNDQRRNTNRIEEIIKDLSGSVGTILDLIGNVEIFSETVEKIKDTFKRLSNGVYIQVMPYVDSILNNRKGLWPYIIFTINNMDRFIAKDRDGYLEVSSESGSNPTIYMLHIRIFKVPGIGIPIPLVMPVYFEVSSVNVRVEINVYKISVEPLLLVYDTSGFNEKKKYDLGSLLENYLHNSSIKLYAVPVWVDEEGHPVAPVLLRGPYNVGLKRSNGLAVESSLALKLYYLRGDDKKNATMLSIVSVTDIGIPLEFLTVPYSKLYELAREGDNGKLVIEPAWYASGILSVAGLGSSSAMKGYKLSLAPTKAFNIIETGNNVIVYIGVKSNESLLDKLKIKDLVDKIEEGARNAREDIDKIRNALGKNLSGLREYIVEVNNSFNNDESDIGSHISVMEDTLQSIREQLSTDVKRLVEDIASNIMKNLVKQFVKKLIEVTAVALIPDPSGLSNVVAPIIGSLIDEILGIIDAKIEEYINNIFGEGGSNGEKSATDLIVKRLLSYTIVYTVESVGKDFLNNIVHNSLLNSAKNLLEEIIGAIDNHIKSIEGHLTAVILAIKKLKAMAMYEPILVSKIYMFNGDGRLVNAKTLLGNTVFGHSNENYMMAIDVLEIDDPSSEKLVLIQPYSVLISGLSKIVNGLFGGNTKLPNVIIGIPGALRYASAWLNYVIDVKNRFTESQTSKDIPDKLLQAAEHIKNINKEIEHWIILNSININAVLVPTYLYIPPTTINTQPQAKS